jgi:hypothetical protein
VLFKARVPVLEKCTFSARIEAHAKVKNSYQIARKSIVSNHRRLDKSAWQALKCGFEKLGVRIHVHARHIWALTQLDRTYL